MCRTFTACVAVVVFAAPLVADEPKTKASAVGDKFEALKKNFNAASDAYEQLRQSGKSKEAQAALEKDNAQKYLIKMLELAFFNPKDPLAFEVLFFVAVHGESDTYLWEQVCVQFRTHHANSPEMKHVVRLLDKRTDETDALLHALIVSNPDKKVAALSCQYLLDHVGTLMHVAEEVNSKPALKPLLERRAGADYLKRVLVDLDKNRKEVKELTDLLDDKYKDVLPDLSAGKPLPEFTLEDLGGKKIKLADLRGKVVVLCFLTTTDDRASAILGQQRELAKKHGNQHLALVNVFVDERKERVAEFLKKQSTPATAVWGGWKNNLLEEWCISATPTVWIVDGKGVIRFRDRQGAELEEGLLELLKE